MIKIAPLSDKTEEQFNALFKCYYAELGCGDNVNELLNDYVIPDLKAGLLNVDILHEDGAPAGFVIYQTDDITSDWNFKEGWGDVREIYVSPHSRRKGLGKFLLFTAEMRLRESGTDKAYCLPAENTEGFFKACGYAETDEYNPELDVCAFVKTDLNNACK